MKGKKKKNRQDMNQEDVKDFLEMTNRLNNG